MQPRHRLQHPVQPAVAHRMRRAHPCRCRPPAYPARRNGCACRGRASRWHGQSPVRPACHSGIRPRQSGMQREIPVQILRAGVRTQRRAISAQTPASPSGCTTSSPSIAPRRMITTSRFSPKAAPPSCASVTVVSQGCAAAEQPRATPPTQEEPPIHHLPPLYRRLNSGEARTSPTAFAPVFRPAPTPSNSCAAASGPNARVARSPGRASVQQPARRVHRPGDARGQPLRRDPGLGRFGPAIRPAGVLPGLAHRLSGAPQDQPICRAQRQKFSTSGAPKPKRPQGCHHEIVGLARLLPAARPGRRMVQQRGVNCQQIAPCRA